MRRLLAPTMDCFAHPGNTPEQFDTLLPGCTDDIDSVLDWIATEYRDSDPFLAADTALWSAGKAERLVWNLAHYFPILV